MTLDPGRGALARRDWSRGEVEATVEDYFAMFADELRRREYNKSAHRQALLVRLDGRNDRAVDWAAALAIPPPRSDVASRPGATQVIPGRDYVALQRENSALGRSG